ncbi:MAG: nitroreductase [Sphingomonadales bacterium]|nr:nitroreductase [Sphingomonadales bacterium]
MRDQNEAVSFERIVAERRSVRAFLPTPVPQQLIEQVLFTAQQAPSNCNAQPWIVHIVSGLTADRVRSELIDGARSGQTDADVPPTTTYVDQYKSRRIGAAVALFEATGVARDDVVAREESFLRNFAFFGAPHAAFIFMPRYFGLREAADCGMYAQTLMLALTAHGLASCAQGALSHHVSRVRALLDVPDDLVCLFGMSFGYPDYDHPADAVRTVRAPLAETVVFHA